MVEEVRVGECHVHLILLVGIDHLGVGHRSSRLGNILHAVLTGVVDRVSEREKGV